jgi:CHAT domain-containing protein
MRLGIHELVVLWLTSKQKAEGRTRPRLHWCPTGAFTFLPLHAAGIYHAHREDCCSDYVVSSYTSTLSALLRAQQTPPVFTRETARLALVAAKEAHKSTMPTLWNVDEEVKQVHNVADERRIFVNADCVIGPATVSQVAKSLEIAPFAHMACHGLQDATDALSSGFCLQDGTLTVSRLMELDLKNAFFAFLSACETAKGDAKQPDQTVHLAATILFVGFRSIVATMW